ncbi:MAG: discoidin domain-containing protein [Victivallaceae bacterium]|nr:discoidin domain-containing protein [Victivallaceae bacterium]
MPKPITNYKKWLIALTMLSVAIMTEKTIAAEPAIQKPYTQLWLKRIKGKNLASGLPVHFSKKCLATKSEDAKYWLTNGEVVDYFWEKNNGAVSWTTLPASGISISLDLGEIQPINKIVLRCLGGVGAVHSSWQFPKEFSLYISKDGIKYYKAAGYSKLNEGEKDQSDFIKNYYLEPEGYGYIYPFEFLVLADARYIGIKIVPSTHCVKIDELAVIAASKKQQKTTRYNSTYSFSPETFMMSGISARPQFNSLVISSNMPTPNIFVIDDFRTKKSPATLVMELPDGIVLEQPTPTIQRKIKKAGTIYTYIELPLYIRTNWAQPMDHYFFSVKKKIPTDATALFYVKSKGESLVPRTVPVKVITIPEIKPKLKTLQVSLAWMREKDALNYPHFFQTWKRLGFQAIPCFPREWENFPKKGNSNTVRFQKFLEDARENGFKIIMHESPFGNEMRRGHTGGDEMFSQIPQRPNRNLCPSYRGKWYAEELNRVKENVKKIRPDFVYWDIEYWYQGAKDGKSFKCTRCVEGQKLSGKSMDEYLKIVGTETFHDLYDAVKQGSADFSMPVVASYNHHMGIPIHHFVVDFTKIYPRYISQALPSAYVSGDAQTIHDIVRSNYRLLKKKVIVPWLTAGTYGKYEPYKLEHMILESFMNGACGITYYSYGDFDTPLYFYYHAKALAEVAPYENIIVNGEIIELVGTNKGLTYSGVVLKNQMLLLVGNYAHNNEMTEYSIPLNGVKEIKDLQTGKLLKSSQTLTIKVPKGKIRFFYIRGK